MTLAEVIASLSFIAIILGITAQLLYSHIGFWERNDRSYQRQHLLKFVYQTVNSDLSSLFSGNFLPENSLAGDEYQLTGWIETAQGLKQVKYRYDLGNKSLLRAVGYWGSELEEQKLLTKVVNWRFEYYDAETGNWRTEWNPALKSKLPSLIRLTVVTEQGNLGTLSFAIHNKHTREQL
ncbi:MAG TPA: type II secretion system protein GspJ [Bacillota bacterium]|nr:type II secretion system protein GspJ [Bacillota bacterium]HOL10805.1 type II secretion system protein GspJ [Bacillota bacterium]HPO96432.1 type II secretion system protein GspJ [Bacillota bacterium]